MALPAYLKKLTYELNKHPSVHKADLTVHEIRIKYKNGLSERWVRTESRYKKNCCWIYPLPDDPGNPFDHLLPIGHEYETNPLEDDHEEKLKYFAIRFSDYQKQTFVSQRIGIQSLVDRLSDEGWIDIRYPHDVLMGDFIKFRSDKLTRFDRYNLTKVYGYGPGVYHGLKILEHFVPWGSFGNEKSMIKAWNRPFNMYS